MQLKFWQSQFSYIKRAVGWDWHQTKAAEGCRKKGRIHQWWLTLLHTPRYWYRLWKSPEFPMKRRQFANKHFTKCSYKPNTKNKSSDYVVEVQTSGKNNKLSLSQESKEQIKFWEYLLPFTSESHFFPSLEKNWRLRYRSISVVLSVYMSVTHATLP
jgi:hypothetical protein